MASPAIQLRCAVGTVGTGFAPCFVGSPGGACNGWWRNGRWRPWEPEPLREHREGGDPEHERECHVHVAAAPLGLGQLDQVAAHEDQVAPGEDADAHQHEHDREELVVDRPSRAGPYTAVEASVRAARGCDERGCDDDPERRKQDGEATAAHAVSERERHQRAFHQRRPGTATTIACVSGFSSELIGRSGYEREGFAAHYDRYRPRPPRALLESLLQLARVERAALVVDLGAEQGSRRARGPSSPTGPSASSRTPPCMPRRWC